MQPTSHDGTLPSLGSMLAALVEDADLPGLVGLTIGVDLPVELDVWSEQEAVTGIGAAPPTQIVETTIMPVFHRLSVEVVWEVV